MIGLAVYFALLVAAFAVLFRGAGRSPPRIAIAACFAALVLHTWTYADFLEDPFTWTLLASGWRSLARRACADSGSTAEPDDGPRCRRPRRPRARCRFVALSVLAYLKRLVATGAAYQFGDILAKGFALITLPLYRATLARRATAPPNRC